LESPVCRCENSVRLEKTLKKDSMLSEKSRENSIEHGGYCTTVAFFYAVMQYRGYVL
jgi:hypothetical protein